MGMLMVIMTAWITPGDDRFRLAIVGFTEAVHQEYYRSQYGRKPVYLDVLVENLSNILQSEFDLVEREKIDLINKEREIAKKNNGEENSEIIIGRLIGAKYVLTGVITELNKEIRYFKGYGVVRETTNCRMAASFRILNTANGEIITVGESGTSKSYRNSPSPDTIIRDLSKDLSIDIANQVSKCFKEIRDRQRSQEN